MVCVRNKSKNPLRSKCIFLYSYFKWQRLTLKTFRMSIYSSILLLVSILDSISVIFAKLMWAINYVDIINATLFVNRIFFHVETKIKILTIERTKCVFMIAMNHYHIFSSLPFYPRKYYETITTSIIAINLFLGDMGVGKSCLLHQFTEHKCMN